MKSRIAFILVVSLFMVTAFSFLASDAFAITITLDPVDDTTIYQGTVPNDADGNAENNSCGGGSHVIAGTTELDKEGGSFPRRVLIRFDIESAITIPNSTIDSVTLSMDINRSGDRTDRNFSLHPVTQDWGEGVQDCDSDPGQGVEAAAGDATWLSAKHNLAPAWFTPGGDFGAASATSLIPGGGTATWDSAVIGNEAMVTDVQNWLDNPDTMNFGWIVKIDDETLENTARRFGSREGGPAPVLTIDYTPGPGVVLEECCDIDGVFNGTCSIVVEGTCENSPPIQNPEPTCSPNNCPQPIGACCNVDESCSEPVTGAECAAAGGEFQGDGSQCSDNNVNCGLEPFVDALPWPVPEVQPIAGELGGAATYEITMDEVSQQLHRDLPNTTVWGYQGSFPGPTLETTVGKPITVKVINNLPTSGHYLTVDTCPHGPNYWRDSSLTSVHLHGGHVPSRFDGQPEYTFFPGEFDTYEYPNTQLPATLWYHDHALGITRLNVYMGLAAYYMLRPDCDPVTGNPNDPECNGDLPPKAYEVPAVIQDRLFNEDGSLRYPVKIRGGGFFGDKVLVNGKVWPYLNVNQGKYRFRFLNGSQAREYTLKNEIVKWGDPINPPPDPLPDIPFTLIGTDGGLVTEPIDLETIHMVPAERFDVVIDFENFPAGTEIVLRNEDTATPRLPNIMKFIVQGQLGHTAALPATLTPVDTIPESEANNTPRRYFNLVNVSENCAGGEWLIQTLDGPDPATANVIGSHWDDIDVKPVLGTTEIFEFINESGMMHPMHVHLVQFQILDRCEVNNPNNCETLAKWEETPLSSGGVAKTWKDTVMVPPGTRVRVIARFESFPGKFPAHCHLLDHEDHEMMRQFQTTWDPALADVDGVCAPQEDCISNPDDCGTVPGNLCGNKLCEIGDGENFENCPADCAGKTKGKNPFNCGSLDSADPGYNCGYAVVGTLCFTFNNQTDCEDNGCNWNSELSSCDMTLFDGCTTNDFFCRVKARVPACCGDSLCEGQETAANCATDCAGECIPTEPDRERTCDDGIDNDCDGLIDLQDDECNGCQPTGPEGPPGDDTCSDGFDNDCDGFIDDQDPGCVGGCSGYTDRRSCNDAPGCRWDRKQDPPVCVDEVCTPSPEGPSGDPTCQDNTDNDCDGLIDAADPDCQQCEPTEPTEVSCNDGVDNDCDDAIDCDDTDCADDPVCLPDCSELDEAACKEAQNCRWKNKDGVCVDR
jgi:spore coat protein A